MSDDANLEEEVLQKYGVSREKYEKGKRERKQREFKMNRFLRTGGMLEGEALDFDEQEIEDIEKVSACDFNGVLCRPDVILPIIDLLQEIEEKKEKAKKAEEENIEGWLRVMHPETGEEIFLKVMVDTGATVNAISYGLLIDCQLESLKIQLKDPRVIGLAVKKFELECDEQISIDWMGRGDVEGGTSTFYVFPRGQANITDRAILSKEWLNKRHLLYYEDPSHYLKPLIGGKQSVSMRFESQSVSARHIIFANRACHRQASEKAAREQERQRAMNDRASSSKAKDAYQKREGQKEQGSSSTGPARPNEARKCQ